MIEMKDMLNPSSYGLNESIWNFVPLNSVVFFQEGPGLRNWQWTSSGMKVINVKNILWNRTVNTNNSDKYISLNEFEKQYKHFQIDDKDIVMASSGNTYSKIGRINSENLPLMMNTSVIRFKSLNENLLNNDFLYFFLCSNYMKNQIDCFVTGAAQPNFGPYHLNRMSIPLPSIKIQIKIAEILSAYDDLIENNLKRIKLLEQAAQNIYKEWFVNLRFPGYETTPINEETGLPEGWEYGVVSDFGKVITGKTPSTKRKDFYGVDIPFIKTPDMHRNIYMDNVEQYLSKAGADSQKNKYLPKNTVIVACIGARAGVVAITSKASQTNQQINAIIAKDVNANYWFYFFFKGFKDKLRALGSSGATMTNVSKGKFEGIELIYPSEILLKKFNSTVSAFFDKILILQNQNQKLKTARDILLPRLMNRTIEVE